MFVFVVRISPFKRIFRTVRYGRSYKWLHFQLTWYTEMRVADICVHVATSARTPCGNGPSLCIRTAGCFVGLMRCVVSCRDVVVMGVCFSSTRRTSGAVSTSRPKSRNPEKDRHTSGCACRMCVILYLAVRIALCVYNTQNRQITEVITY